MRARPPLAIRCPRNRPWSAFPPIKPNACAGAATASPSRNATPPRWRRPHLLAFQERGPLRALAAGGAARASDVKGRWRHLAARPRTANRGTGARLRDFAQYERPRPLPAFGGGGAFLHRGGLRRGPAPAAHLSAQPGLRQGTLPGQIREGNVKRTAARSSLSPGRTGAART